MRLAPAFALLIVLAACGPAVRGPAGEYRNPAKGFALVFPAGWEVKEGELGLDVIGLSPNEGPSDHFRDNVTVASADMPAPVESDAILDGNIPSMMNVITDFKPGGRGRMKMGARDAAWLDYTQRQGIFRLTVKLFALPGKKHAYLIYCTSETAAWDRFQPKCEQVVNSFRITE